MFFNKSEPSFTRKPTSGCLNLEPLPVKPGFPAKAGDYYVGLLYNEYKIMSLLLFSKTSQAFFLNT